MRSLLWVFFLLCFSCVPLRGTQQSFIREGSALRSNPLPIYIPFLTKKIPFSYIFYWQMVPLSQPIVELCISLNCCKRTFKISINHKTRTFFPLFQNHKMHLLPLWAFLQTENDRFPYPFIYFNLWNFYPFICTWNLREAPPTSFPGSCPTRPRVGEKTWERGWGSRKL